MPKQLKNDEPYGEIMDISPKLAMDWLSTIPDYQRKIDERQVNKLVMAIQRNEWRLNGAAIVFNEKGELIDGQHRLTAIYKSGKTVQSLVVTGVSKDEITFASLGDTKPRRVSDFLHTTNVHVVASVLRYVWFMENKMLSYAVRLTRNHQPSPKFTNPPVAEIVRLAKKHAEPIAALVEPLNEARRLTKGGSWVVFLMYYFETYRPKEEAVKVAEFFARVGDGVDLKADSPILQLRKRCAEQAGNLVIPVEIKQALILKALNAYLMGQKLERLTFSAERESFPPLRGYDPGPAKSTIREDAKKLTHEKGASA
jgi:hypothetical protein